MVVENPLSEHRRGSLRCGKGPPLASSHRSANVRARYRLPSNNKASASLRNASDRTSKERERASEEGREREKERERRSKGYVA